MILYRSIPNQNGMLGILYHKVPRICLLIVLLYISESIRFRKVYTKEICPHNIIFMLLFCFSTYTYVWIFKGVLIDVCTISFMDLKTLNKYKIILMANKISNCIVSYEGIIQTLIHKEKSKKDIYSYIIMTRCKRFQWTC